MTHTTSVHTSINNLLARAYSLENYSIRQLSQHLKIDSSHQKNKGWIGQLLETYFGIDKQNYAGPDFKSLQVELKTIPLLHTRPMESTYITTLPLHKHFTVNWEQSVVYKKVKRILWIPLISTEKNTPPAEKIIGRAVLWEPSFQELNQLKQDWEEFLDKILLGELDLITAHMGTYLQIRPKANNALATCWTINTEGEKIKTLPRGFYLRPILTRKIFTTQHKG